MSGLKLYCILGLVIVASITTVFVVSRQKLDTAIVPNPPQQPLATTIPSSVVEEVPERANYQTIPLETITSNLRGTDPGEVALNAFGKIATTSGSSRQVEVAYPQLNQAIVTITQLGVSNSTSGFRYRVEMSPFGRSILVGVGSPRVWQIVWAGSQVKCTRSKQDWSPACR